MSASPIRDSAGKLAITPGEVVYANGEIISRQSAYDPICYPFNDEEGDENHPDNLLICEAFNVTNATGRTPAELTALVRELRDWIKATIHLSGYSRELVAMQKTIAKTEGI
jgi:hypothetical protein